MHYPRSSGAERRYGASAPDGTGPPSATPSSIGYAEPFRRTEASIEHWLRGALPENGSFEAFEQRAQGELAQRDIEVGQGTVHDWVWANADWECPGAVTFEREEDEGRQSESDEHLGVDEADQRRKSWTFVPD